MELASRAKVFEGRYKMVLLAGLVFLAVLASLAFADEASALRWEDEEMISSGYPAGLATVAAEGDDVYVVYVRYVDGHNNLAFTMTDDPIWTYPEAVYPHASEQMYPDMVVEKGVAHLVWTGNYDGDEDIYYSRFNGTKWSEPFQVNAEASPARQYSPAIAAEGGMVHIVYIDRQLGDGDVFYRSFDGRTWTNPRVISTDLMAGMDQREPAIEVADGKVHACWSDYPGRIRYRVLDKADWKDPIDPIPSEPLDGPNFPSLAWDGTKLNLAYHTYNTTNWHINMTRFDGVRWSPPETISTGRTNSLPFLTIDAELGNIVLCYNDAYQFVTFRHFDGTAWADSTKVNNTPGMAHYAPDIAMDGGFAHVVCAQTISGNNWIKHRECVIDETPPTSLVTADPPYWMDPGGVDMHWTATDDYAVGTVTIEYRYSTDNETWSSWEEELFEDGETGPSISGTYLFEPPDGDGYYELRTIATDVLGKVETGTDEAEMRLGLDTGAPSGTIMIDDDKVYTPDATVTLTLTYDDDTSGVAKVRYSNEAIGGDEPWENPAPIREWDLGDQSGQVTVYYQVIDMAGYTSMVYSDDIVLDTELPTGTFVVPGELIIVNTTLITLTLTFEDDTEVEAVRLSNDGIWDEFDWRAPTGSVAWQLPEGDIGRVVYYQVKDVTEKVSEIYELSLRVDTTGPRLEAMDPADGSTDVPVDDRIVLQFSEVLKPLSVKANLDIYFIDEDEVSHDLIGNITWEQNWQTFTFEPFSDLREGTTYYVNMGPEVQDLAGNGLYPAVMYSFTTEGEPPDGGNDNGTDTPWGVIILLVAIIALMGVVIVFLLFKKEGSAF